MNADGSDERPLTTAVQCLQCAPDWASLPPDSVPSVPAPAGVQEPTAGPQQKFSRVSLTRRRFARDSHVWLVLEATVGEKIEITIRHAKPSRPPSVCASRPTRCPLAGQGEIPVHQGLNRSPLRRLFSSIPTPGRYWLQVKSPSSAATAGLAFRVVPPRHRRRHRR